MNDLELNMQFMECAERASERLNRMNLGECIDYWNDSAVDHYHRESAIHQMNDLEWWFTLANDLGDAELLSVIAESIEKNLFDKSHSYFFYDPTYNEVYSFSNKAQLLDIVDPIAFLEHMLEEELNG